MASDIGATVEPSADRAIELFADRVGIVVGRAQQEGPRARVPVTLQLHAALSDDREMAGQQSLHALEEAAPVGFGHRAEEIGD